MLSPEERAEIDVEMGHYPTREAMGIEALRIVQRYRGWVSDQNLDDIAELLSLPKSHLEGLATFYNLIFRKPVGRHVIMVCDSVSCWIMGGTSVAEYLGKKLEISAGETTRDGRFTLLPIVCLGACDRAPTMMVGDDLHGDLTPSRIDEILEAYR